MDRDVEKATSQGALDGSDTATLNLDSVAVSPSQHASLTRTRSQNGYGVEEEAAVQAQSQPREDVPTAKDAFEVGWDDGDNDPLCPRSFNKSRKWMIVIIACLGSFTV